MFSIKSCLALKAYDRLLRYHSNQLGFYCNARMRCVEMRCVENHWVAMFLVDYVPGGLCSWWNSHVYKLFANEHISSLLMNIIPAIVAGVKHIYVTTPYFKLADNYVSWQLCNNTLLQISWQRFVYGLSTTFMVCPQRLWFVHNCVGWNVFILLE